jgi:hypothetical protein
VLAAGFTSYKLCHLDASVSGAIAELFERSFTHHLMMAVVGPAV